MTDAKDKTDSTSGSGLGQIYDTGGSVATFVEKTADVSTVKLVAKHYGRIFNALEIIDAATNEGAYAALAKATGVASGWGTTIAIGNLTLQSGGAAATLPAKALQSVVAVGVGILVDKTVTDGLMLVHEPSRGGELNVDGYTYDPDTDQWYDYLPDPYILDYGESVPVDSEHRERLDSIREFRLSNSVYIDRAGNQFIISKNEGLSVVRPDDTRIDIDERAIIITPPNGPPMVFFRPESAELVQATIDGNGDIDPRTLKSIDEGELLTHLVVDIVEDAIPTDDPYFYPEFIAEYKDGAGNHYGVRSNGQIAVFRKPGPTEEAPEAPREVLVPADEGYPLDDYSKTGNSEKAKPFEDLIPPGDPAAATASPGDIVRAALFRGAMGKRGVSEETIASIDIFEQAALYAVEQGKHPNFFNRDGLSLPDYAIEVGLLYQEYTEKGFSSQLAIRSAREGVFEFDATEGPIDESPAQADYTPNPDVGGSIDVNRSFPSSDFRADGGLFVSTPISSPDWTPPTQSNPPSYGPPATYTVEPGDSLWSIAEKTGISFQDVLEANAHLTSPDLINPGDVINLSRDTESERYIDGDLWDATEGPPGTYGRFDPFGSIDFSSVEPTAGRTQTFYAPRDVWDPTESQDDVREWWSSAVESSFASREIAPPRGTETDGTVEALNGSLKSAYSLYSAIDRGDTFGIAQSGLSLAQAIDGFDDVRFDAAATDGTASMNAGIGLAGSVWNFYQAIDRGDALGATGAGLALAQQGTSLYASSIASTQSAVSAAQSASAALGMAAGALGLVTSAIAGDFVGMVASTLMMIPIPAFQIVGVVLAVANAMGIFGGDPEPYEAPTGDGHFTRMDDYEVGITASGTAGNQGDHVRASLSGRMGELQEHLSETPTGTELVRVALQETLRELEVDLPDDADIIPERLPSLSFNGYFYIAEFSDPGTAHVREIAIAPADIVDTLVEVAHYSQAVAPQWEADTVAELYEAGDPQYWYTEEQHAFVESGEGSPAAFTPIALDLSGDGVLSGDALVYFDADDDNYRELSQWISPADGVLGLDHDFDGRIDAASELFSNPALASAYRGLGGLAWLDVNDDGVIDARDPVFDSLRVWQDANADGISDADELSTLDEAGITSLHYTAAESSLLPPTARTSDGSSIAMAGVPLAAEARGVRIDYRSGGMLVEEENGETLFYVSDAIDLGPNEEKSRNVAGGPRAVLIDRDGVQRELRATADAVSRATPFGEASAGLLAFGIGFGNSQAATRGPGESGPVSSADNSGSTAESVDVQNGLAEPVFTTNAAAAVSNASRATETALAPPETTGEGQNGESPDNIGGEASGAPALVPRASFEGLPDLLTTSDPVQAGIPLDAGTPFGGPSLSASATFGDSLNGGPLAGDDAFTISEDAVALITQAALLANDADFSNTGVMAITAVRNAEHGSVSLDSDGLIRFTPDHNYFGEASFEYVVTNSRGRSDVGTATINVKPVNDIPIVANESVTAIEDIPGIFAGTADTHPLLRNDSDVEADLLSISAVSNATHGAVSLASDSTVTFIPDANYFGAAQFDYTVSDGNGGEAVATAFVDVLPVNDAPRITGADYMGNVTGSILASDVDNSASDLRFSITQHPLNGAASIDALTGIWTYSSTPCNPYTGADPFVVTVTDPDGDSDSTIVDTRHIGSSCDSGKKPLIIDLDGDGLDIVGIDDSTVFFDVNDDGWREKIAWAGPEDGLLVYDKDADGNITDYDEISFVSYLDGARTDLEGLRGFDTNDDSLLSPLDRDWDVFGVWQDRNQDGITDAGEFSSLDDRGITRVELDGERHHEHLDDGSVLFGTTNYVRSDGSTGLVGDVRLAYDPDDVMPVDEKLVDLVDLPRSAAEEFDRQEAVSAPHAGHLASELEREITQLRADMAAFETSAEELLAVHPELLEFTIAETELDEPKGLVT